MRKVCIYACIRTPPPGIKSPTVCPHRGRLVVVVVVVVVVVAVVVAAVMVFLSGFRIRWVLSTFTKRARRIRISLGNITLHIKQSL